MDDIKLGDLARDRITGFEGIVIARTQWLRGCDRLTLQPRELKDGKPIEPQTFDLPDCVLVTADPLGEKPKPVKTGGPRPEPVRR